MRQEVKKGGSGTSPKAASASLPKALEITFRIPKIGCMLTHQRWYYSIVQEQQKKEIK